MAAATALGNEVRAGKDGVIGSVLAAPFERPPTPDYDTGIDDPDLSAEPLPKSLFGWTPAKDLEWPPEPPPAPAKPLPPVVWPTDEDHPTRPTSKNPSPPVRKGKTMTTTTTSGASARDYAKYLDKSTPGTQAEKLSNAAAAAARDANRQHAEAEDFRAKARQIDGLPAMQADAEHFRSEARQLDKQVAERRDIAARFRNAAAGKAAGKAAS